MANYDTQISNASYMNKDFSAIYPELLDYAEKVSHKWQPSLSNESDPGVVLLKLCALIADKNNYNIDKNILELFPESVTQYENAREIYDQCGYTMHHYRAAKVDVNLTFDNIPKDIDLKTLSACYLPTFTHVTDIDQETSFTLIGELTNDIILPSTKGISLVPNKTVTVRALQGTHKQYTINNDSLIMYSHLDYNNRIYFSETNVAENGVFIRSADSDTTLFWDQVDNLMTQELGSQVYKFGVSRDTNTCYIEFPVDCVNLIGNGVYIDYVLTDGYSGNVGSYVLKTFLQDTEINVEYTDTNSSDSVAVTTDNIYITNIGASYEGADPETIDEAFRNYQRVKGTFDTLVSVKDYTNYLLSQRLVSNGFVTDRTNDPETAFNVVTVDNSDRQVVESRQLQKLNELLYTKVTTNGEDSYVNAQEPCMTPFDLKIYGYQYVNPVTNETQFELSFTPISDIENIKNMFEETKNISHDFVAHEQNKIQMIELGYTIDLQVIPHTKLTVLQQVEVINNIKTTLLRLLNSSQMTFGTEVDYGDLYDAIMASDSRIRAIILSDISYTPEFIIDISDDNKNKTEEIQAQCRTEIQARCIVSGVTPCYNYDTSFIYHLGDTGEIISKSNESELTITTTLKLTPSEVKGSNKYQVTLIDNENIYITAPHLVDDTKGVYTNNCKFFHNITDGVAKDAVHMLKEKEWIVFLWKDSDDASAPYNYKRYTGTSDAKYVLPTKAIAAYNEFADIVKNNDSYKTAWGHFANMGDDGSEGKVEDKNNNEINKAILQCNHDSVMTGLTDKISMQKVNVITIDSNSNSDITKFYWVTNNIENNRYILATDASGEYILKQNETFFYSTSSNSTTYSVGEGTKIKIGNASEKFQCDVLGDGMLLHPKTITEQELWTSIDEEITITEMEFYNLGSGTTLEMDAQKELTSTLTYHDSVNYSYKTPDSTDSIVIPSRSGENIGWKIGTILNLNCSKNSPQTIVKDTTRTHTITFPSSYKFEEPEVGEEGKKVKVSYYIQSSEELHLRGGTNLPTYGASFYIYTSSSKDSEITAGTTTFTITFSKNNDTVIKLYNTEKANVTFSNGITQLGSNDMYTYYKVPKAETPETMTIDAGKSISNLEKYIICSDTTPSTVIDWITDNAPDYDFTYCPDASTLIPLKDTTTAKGLLRPQHPYNKCTICRWLVKDANNSINIANRVR